MAEFPPDVAAQILPPELKREGQRLRAPSAAPADLTEAERSVWGLLSPDEAAHIDAPAEASGLPVSELAGVLLGLELRELIRQLPGRCFVKKL